MSGSVIRDRSEFLGHLQSQLEGFTPGSDVRARASRRLILERISLAPLHSSSPLDRASFEPGHITGSAIVLSPDRQEALLVFHRRLRKWLQPGGHVEAVDSSILDTVLREAAEETGARLDRSWSPRLINADVHAIPAYREEPAHLHFDLVYLLRAASKVLGPVDEDTRAAWFPLIDPPEPDTALASSFRRSSREGSENRKGVESHGCP